MFGNLSPIKWLNVTDYSAVHSAGKIPPNKESLFGVFLYAHQKGETQMEVTKPLTIRLDDAWEKQSSYWNSANAKATRIIRFLGYDSEGHAINQVELWLLVEELPVFMHALLAHHLLLPTEYMQTIDQTDNGFCVRIRSHESPKTFVARLSAALNCLKHPA